MIINKSSNVIQFVSRILAVVLFSVFLTLYLTNYRINDNLLSFLVILSSVVEFTMLICNKGVFNTGLLMMFFLYNWICMNGFVIAYFFDKNYINFKSISSMSFVQNPFYQKAIIIANIVLLVFVIALEFYSKKSSIIASNSKKNIEEDNRIVDNEDKSSKFVNAFTIIALLFCLIYLFYFVFSNNLFLANYNDYLNVKKAHSFLSHTIIISSLAIAMLFSSGTKKAIGIGSFIYLLTALLHFSVGNRGEVLYSAVVVFALYSLRFKKIKMKHIIITGVLLVTIIPMIRIIRSGGIYSFKFNFFSSFLDVLCEEGFQISPFTYIVEYVHKGNGYVHGMTYVNDFLDFILRRFSLSSPLENIEKYVIRSIMPYEGMGFSMIAELYYNFTVVGVCMIYGIFATFLRTMDYKIYHEEIDISKKLLYSMIMVEMINITRNDASTVPVYLLYTLLFYIIYKYGARRKKVE